MKNEQLYRDTVDIILDAYNKGKLEHTNACGCFIGNIIEKRYPDKKPMKFTEGTDPVTIAKYRIEFPWSPDWYHHLTGSSNGDTIIFSNEEAAKQLKSTGYSVKEVIALEQAFERALICEDYTGERLGQLEGMKAALKKLAQIHETMPGESLERLEVIHQKVYV